MLLLAAVLLLSNDVVDPFDDVLFRDMLILAAAHFRCHEHYTRIMPKAEGTEKIVFDICDLHEHTLRSRTKTFVLCFKRQGRQSHGMI